MKKIVHVITGLQNGGAEMMLYRLLKNMDTKKYDIKVVSMTDRGVFAEKIENLGIEVYTLDMKRGVPTIGGIKKLSSILDDSDIVQTWMYHADLLGFICGKIIKKKKVIWGIHHSNLDKDKNKRLVLLVAKINKYLSKYVDKIVSCSEYATKVHVKFGYDKSKFVNIPNGFDLSEFYNRKNAKVELFNEFGDKIKDKRIVCHVARWDPLKDYNTLIKSIRIVGKEINNIKFLLCGPSIDYNNDDLVKIIKDNDVEELVLLLGRRTDIPKIMSASDILVLSSTGEAFPNVIGEAMACETPCVVTDVGDCAYIVNNHGRVAEKENEISLSNAMIDILELPEYELKRLGLESRKRILENFEISKIIDMYEKIYQ